MNPADDAMTSGSRRDALALRRFKSIVFTLAGIGLMAGTLWWADATRRFVAHAASASGTVVKLNAGGSHPEVRFTTAAGEVVEYPQGGMIWGYRVGDRVEVLYELANPISSATINRPGALWGFVAMNFLLGASFVLLAQLARWRPDRVD